MQELWHMPWQAQAKNPKAIREGTTGTGVNLYSGDGHDRKFRALTVRSSVTQVKETTSHFLATWAAPMLYEVMSSSLHTQTACFQYRDAFFQSANLPRVCWTSAASTASLDPPWTRQQRRCEDLLTASTRLSNASSGAE